MNATAMNGATSGGPLQGGSSRAGKATAKEDRTAERVVNLLATLSNWAQKSSEPVDSSWLIQKIPGYSELKDPARRLHLDVLLLNKAGAPVRVLSESGKATRYQLLDSGETETITFDEEEAKVIALAAKLGSGTQLSALSRAGWTKIAAANDFVSEPTQLRAVGDDASIAGEDYDQIVQAMVKKSPITFEYRRDPQAAVQAREMEPWHIIAHAQRNYLVGFDRSRRAPRSFRMTRISNVRRLDAQSEQPVPSINDATELLLEQLSSQKVTVRFRGTPDHALAQGAVPQGEEFELVDVSRDWFIREAAQAAPEIVVTAPVDVREAVLALLHQAVQHSQTEVNVGER
ncbi:helix-turn-helix transcriptional regulator [Corynebacterium gerontici]|nr:WYL domain-containing protein [Corynebacterium gerontici]